MRFLTAILLLITSIATGQKIRLLDSNTHSPIYGATLYTLDKSKSKISDFDGVIYLNAFAKADTVIISDVAYQKTITTIQQLINKGPELFLTPLENNLGEIVLSASKFAQKSSLIPQKIVGITAESVSFSNPQTAADLLENSGQVFVQKSQLGGGSPIIRGFSTNRLLITVDGSRFNTAIFRSGNVQNIIAIDPFAIDKTEVVLGPGAVIYGSDAVGGVLNFYTKKPQLSNESYNLTGNAQIRYSSANSEKTGHIDFNYGTRKWGFLSSISHSNYGDQTMGKYGPEDYLRNNYVVTENNEDITRINENPRKQIHTGFSSYNLMQKIRFTPNSDWDFNFNLSYATTSNTPRYDNLTRTDHEGTFRFARWDYGPQKWLNSSLQLDYSKTTRFFDKMQSTFAYQNFEESRIDRRLNQPNLRTRSERVNAYNAAIDFTKSLQNSNTLFYGLEYVYNYVNSNASEINIFTKERSLTETRYPDGSTWTSLAAYASGQFSLSEKINLTTGLRYNKIYLDADLSGNNLFFEFPFDSATTNFGNFTGSLGLNYAPSKTLHFKSNFSTAFRAPNIDDIGKIFDNGEGLIVVPNPDLEAEYAYNAEMGFDLKFSNANSSHFLTFQANAFYTLLIDALVRRNFTLNGENTIIYQGNPTQVQAIQNAGSATIYGLELGLKINLSKTIKVSSQYNLVNGVQDEEDGTTVPVRHVSPNFGNTHFIYTKGNLKLDFWSEYNGTLTAAQIAPEEQDKPWLYALNSDGLPYAPQWHTLNFTGQYQFTKAITLTASLENITNQRYRKYSSGIAAPGRNLIISGKYSF